MTLAAQSFTSIVNHLLAREAWARGRLGRYAGKRVRLAAAGMQVDLTINPQGLLEAPAADATPLPHDVNISVTPGAGAALLAAKASGGRSGAPIDALTRHIRIEGDAELAATIGKLAEHLRWEPEEDVSRWIGDAAAWRLSRLARAFSEGAARAGRNLAHSAAEYLVDERAVLTPKSALARMRDELVALRDDEARLSKRVDRLAALISSSPERR